MTTITPEIRQAIEEAGDEPVRMEDPETKKAYVLVSADVFERMREMMDDEEDRIEKEAWSKLGRKARSEWAEENPY